MTLRHQSSGLRAIGLWFRVEGAVVAIPRALKDPERKVAALLHSETQGILMKLHFLDPSGGLGCSSCVKKVIVLVAYR